MPEIKNEPENRETALLLAGEVLPGAPRVDSERSFASPEAVTRDSVVAMIGGLISQGFKFLTLIYVARRFSTAEFGMVVFTMAINAFLLVISNFGLPVYGTREVSKRACVSSRLLKTIIFSRALLSLLSTAGAVAVLALVPTV